MVTRSLDVEDQQRLVAAFMRVDGMRARSTRDLCISVLERGLGHRLPLVRHERDLHDVWQLVDACLACPGGIHALVEAVETFHRGSRPMLAVRAIVEELLPEPLLRPSERRELRQLVLALEAQGMDEFYLAALPALYRRAVGPVGPPPDRALRGVQDVVAQLEEAPLGTDGVPPLLVFVDDLAGYAKGATATALEEWTGRFAERFGLGPERLQRLRALRRSALAPAASAPSPVRDAFLVIECRPDGAAPDRFLISAWLQLAGEPGVMLRCDEEPQPLGRLPALVEALLVEDGRVAARENPELTVEFVLPRELLNLPFDQFTITVAGLPRRLGIEHPVVMRSLDRLRHQALRHNWRRKWERLRDEPGSATVTWIGEPGRYDGEELYTLLSEPSSVGLALAFPPGEGAPGPVDEVWVGLQAGAPIVAWCRDERDPVRFAEEVRALLGSDPLSLPQRVRDLRRKAVLARTTAAVTAVPAVTATTGATTTPGATGSHGVTGSAAATWPEGAGEPGGSYEQGDAVDAGATTEEEHLGLHLALVFDDADRVPEPYARLKPPA
ncbi:hypothetical protein ACFY4C_24925 [Actinomadura viridis]|uniref:VMAP-C domain-containing protein n=1 Tax=Actinomadura viridis TaxID=58110 RepID=UPI00367465CB